MVVVMMVVPVSRHDDHGPVPKAKSVAVMVMMVVMMVVMMIELGKLDIAVR